MHICIEILSRSLVMCGAIVVKPVTAFVFCKIKGYVLECDWLQFNTCTQDLLLHQQWLDFIVRNLGMQLYCNHSMVRPLINVGFGISEKLNDFLIVQTFPLLITGFINFCPTLTEIFFSVNTSWWRQWQVSIVQLSDCQLTMPSLLKKI